MGVGDGVGDSWLKGAFFFLIEAGLWFLWLVLVAPVTFKIQHRRCFIKAGEILTDDHRMLTISLSRSS